MLVRTLDEITDGPNDVRGDGWRARRHFVRADGLGFSMSETSVESGREMQLWYKYYQEACYVIDGSAEITERDTGACIASVRVMPMPPSMTGTRSGVSSRYAWCASSTPP